MKYSYNVSDILYVLLVLKKKYFNHTSKQFSFSLNAYKELHLPDIKKNNNNKKIRFFFISLIFLRRKLRN